MNYQDLQNIAIDVINILAEKKISIAYLDVIFDEVKAIAMKETKIKKIEQ